jgi:hypothetical protein
MENNINQVFILATRNKYRFPYKGLISVEDLWDLSPEALDAVYKEINAALKTHSEESLIAREPETKATVMLKNMKAIVSYIFEFKETERLNREAEKTNAVQRQRILEALADKEDEALRNMSPDELRAELAKLG